MMGNVRNNRLYLLTLASFQQEANLVMNASKYCYTYFLGASVSTACPPVRMLANLRPPEPLVSGPPPGLPRHFRPPCPDFGASSRPKIVKRRPDSRLGYLGAFQGSWYRSTKRRRRITRSNAIGQTNNTACVDATRHGRAYHYCKPNRMGMCSPYTQENSLRKPPPPPRPLPPRASTPRHST